MNSEVVEKNFANQKNIIKVKQKSSFFMMKFSTFPEPSCASKSRHEFFSLSPKSLEHRIKWFQIYD